MVNLIVLELVDEFIDWLIYFYLVIIFIDLGLFCCIVDDEKFEICCGFEDYVVFEVIMG